MPLKLNDEIETEESNYIDYKVHNLRKMVNAMHFDREFNLKRKKRRVGGAGRSLNKADDSIYDDTAMILGQDLESKNSNARKSLPTLGRNQYIMKYKVTDVGDYENSTANKFKKTTTSSLISAGTKSRNNKGQSTMDSMNSFVTLK